jgi:hypothetical protein
VLSSEAIATVIKLHADVRHATKILAEALYEINGDKSLTMSEGMMSARSMTPVLFVVQSRPIIIALSKFNYNNINIFYYFAKKIFSSNYMEFTNYIDSGCKHYDVSIIITQTKYPKGYNVFQVSLVSCRSCIVHFKSIY